MLAGVVFAILFAVGAVLITSASPDTSKGDGDSRSRLVDQNQ